MGEAFKLECGTCRYNSVIYEGIGFKYTSLKSIASFVTDPALKKVIGEFIQDDFATYDAHQALYARNVTAFKMNCTSRCGRIGRNIGTFVIARDAEPSWNRYRSSTTSRSVLPVRIAGKAS